MGRWNRRQTATERECPLRTSRQFIVCVYACVSLELWTARIVSGRPSRYVPPSLPPSLPPSPPPLTTPTPPSLPPSLSRSGSSDLLPREEWRRRSCSSPLPPSFSPLLPSLPPPLGPGLPFYYRGNSGGEDRGALYPPPVLTFPPSLPPSLPPFLPPFLPPSLPRSGFSVLLPREQWRRRSWSVRIGSSSWTRPSFSR